MIYCIHGLRVLRKRKVYFFIDLDIQRIEKLIKKAFHDS